MTDQLQGTWPEIRDYIRIKAGHRCEHCGPESVKYDPDGNHPERTNSAGEPLKLQVHHIDHNRENNADNNLVALCQKHHLEVHRLDWTPGDILPADWPTVPEWITARKLPYKMSPQYRMGLEDNTTRGGFSEVQMGALRDELTQAIYVITAQIDRAMGIKEKAIAEVIVAPLLWQLERQRDYIAALLAVGLDDLRDDLARVKNEYKVRRAAEEWLRGFEQTQEEAFWETQAARKSDMLHEPSFIAPNIVIVEGAGAEDAEDLPW